MGSNARLKSELLLGPLKKVGRAKRHVDDLDRQVAQFLSRAPFQLRIRQRSDPPERVIYVDAKEPIPEEFALIAGDAVHNLRSALDHVCWGMFSDKAKNPAQLSFPFAKSAEALTDAINTRQMKAAPKQVIDELHALMPYPGGNEYLNAVKAMDERDKHHVILLLGLGIELSVDQMQALVGTLKIPAPAHARIATVGDFLVPLDPDEHIERFDREAGFQPAFTVGFGQGEALVNAPVIPALKAMTRATEDAVRRIAAAYFR